MLLVSTALSTVLAVRVWYDYGSGPDTLDRDQVRELAGLAVVGAMPCLALGIVAIRLVPVLPRFGYAAAGVAWAAALISPAPLVAISQHHLVGTSVAVAVCSWGGAVSVLAMREGWSLSA
ncbi:MAG: hypothetical protein H0V13_06450 [Nocardioidaceae bacterium]|nr:hypothetical protein [Nocardioidaceae bacterium]